MTDAANAPDGFAPALGLARLTPDEYVHEWYEQPEQLYCERPDIPGEYREWKGSGGRLAGEYGYALYRKAPNVGGQRRSEAE